MEIKRLINEIKQDKVKLTAVVGGGGICIIVFVILMLISSSRNYLKYHVWDTLHSSPEYFFNDGVDYNDAGYVQYALGSFKRAINFKNGNFNIDANNEYQRESLYYIGAIYYQKLGQYSIALQFFQKHRDLYKRFNVPNPHEDEMLKVVNVILASDDKTGSAQAKQIKSLGNEALMKNDYQTALKLYQKALMVDPGYLEVYNNIAAVYFQMRDFKNAVEYWKITLLFEPDNIDMYLNVAMACENELKKYEDAILYYEKFYENIPKSDPRAEHVLYRIQLLKEKIKKK